MKLKSKNSFLKRISCIALSLMLCLTSFTLAGFVPTLEAEAAVNTYAEALDLTENSVENLNPEAFTGEAYFENDVATNGYSNVVYSSKGNKTAKYPSSPTQGFMTDSKVGQPNYIVNVYDGDSKVSAPVVYEASSNYGIFDRFVYYVSLNENDYFQLTDYWKGHTTGDNWARWPLALNSNANNNRIYYLADDTKKEWQLSTKEGSKQYTWNKIQYKGSGDKDKYYEYVNGLSFNIRGKRGSKTTVTTKTIGHNYILNYRPIYDIIEGKEKQTVTVGIKKTDYTFKDLYNEVYDNQEKYTATSQNNYFKAVKALINLNVNSFFDGISDNNVDTQVQAAAKKIKEVYNNYNTAATNLEHKHSFTGDAVSQGSATHKIKCAYYDECDGLSDTIAHTYDAGVVTQEATCTEAGKTTYKCTASGCGYSYEDETVPKALGHDYDKAQPIEVEEVVNDQKRILQKHEKKCLRCNYVLEEDHKLKISGTVATCTENCGYTVDSDYKSTGFRITKGNLFDFDAYADNANSTAICRDENGVDKGAVSVDPVNDTITVAGSAYDAYTNYGATSDYYRIPVSELQWYTMSYKPSNDSNQVYAFFSDGEYYLNRNDNKKIWNAYKYDAPVNEEFMLTFQAPANCHFVDFRFGTVKSGAICTFSNISFYESDKDGNPTNGYEVLAQNVTSGSKVLESLENIDIPSADKCKAFYDMYEYDNNKVITTDDTISTNLNIRFDSEHKYQGSYAPTYETGSHNPSAIYTHSKTCTVCQYVDTQPCEFGSLEINGDTATITCSVCGGAYTLDLAAYNAAVTLANESIANTAKYTLASRNELKELLNKNKVSSKTTMEQINAFVTAIEEANQLKTPESKGVLVLEQYSITFNVVDEFGNTTTEVIKETVDYGTLKILRLPDTYKDYAVTSWKRNINGDDSIVGASSRELQVIVKSKAVYSVHVKKTNQEVDNKNAVITLNNKSGNIADIGYVPMEPDGTATIKTVTVDTDAGTIKIGDTTLTAPKYSFYDLDGFEIDGNPVASGQTITLNSKMVIIPVYTPSHTVTITRATGSNFFINRDDVDSVQADWNKKIVTSTRDGSSVVWKTGADYDGDGIIAENEKNVVAYGPTYSFYANSNVTIFAEAIAAPKEPTASIGYFDYDSTLNKVTVVNNFYVPEGKKAVKAGVILSTKSTLANMTNEKRVNFLKAQTNGKFEGTEEKFSGTDTNKNQIRISVTRTANTKFTMYALAYVVVDGQTYYANEVRTINYTPQSA